MRSVRVRLAVGLALVVLVTAILAGAVVTSAAVTVELTDGDACETGGASDGTEVTPENVTTVAGNLTECIVGGEDDDVTPDSPPSEPG